MTLFSLRTPARRSVLAALAWLVAAALTAPGSAAADCPPPAVALTEDELEAGLATARDRGFLWRLEKNGRRSWLYGTVHAAARAWMLPGPSVVQALTESDTVALELDPLDPTVQQRLAAGMAAQRRVVLPDSLAARLRRQLVANCVPLEQAAVMAPELQIATLALMAARRDGMEPSYGIDTVLAGFGRRLGKRLVSLETPELQLQVMQQPDAKATTLLIRKGLDDLERGRARPLMRRIGAVWAGSRLDELAAYESWCDCVRDAADRAGLKRLLDDRNPGLAAAIDALHGGGSRVFAAVGSLHMIGPRSLPALLARRGYRVERVI